MAKLANYVDIIENSMECVVLKVRDNSRTGLICLGCFDGDEDMIRLTKGHTQECTVFRKDGRTYSWEWGDYRHTLVSETMKRCGRMVQECMEDDFDICVTGPESAIRDTCHIRKPGDGKGIRHTYKLMWFGNADICVHRDGFYLRHFKEMDAALRYVRGRLDVTSEERSTAATGCGVITIKGVRK